MASGHARRPARPAPPPRARRLKIAHLAVIVAARNEADRIASTVAAIRGALPAASLWVADDASTDGTPEAAIAAGAQLVGRRRPHGKGGNVTAAAEAALGAPAPPELVLLCDADLGPSARELAKLVAAVETGRCELAIAAFRQPVGGGFGIAVRFARWAIERRCRYRARAPLSGQRAMRAALLRELLPLAAGFGLETGMTIDAVRVGARVLEIDLDLSHRATGRTPAGFAHRGRQLLDAWRAYRARG